ncbi:MAG TPA: rubrerythrin family protein [Victivallales bacterium]|nr:rubrerythrin family protein [Victivallales bacterium]HPO91264.1 rubrerythrin family protein [Victivallales bacterium]HRR06277.1 rubrerythrin family protein [Victivallales bacterium]HRU02105.1 rubrerythrin family protein [Victivallales bacterium]
MSTNENLKAAFAGESQANRKYLAFAKKAEQEGFKQVAKLFRAAAEAETIHAHAHLRVMNGVKNTVENLQEAINGEGYEFKEMYPKFIEEAQKEGNKQAEISFKNANEVEKIHHKLYSKALETVKMGKDIKSTKIWVCKICGNTVEDLPDFCPICNAKKDNFIEIT